MKVAKKLIGTALAVISLMLICSCKPAKDSTAQTPPDNQIEFCLDKKVIRSFLIYHEVFFKYFS